MRPQLREALTLAMGHAQAAHTRADEAELRDNLLQLITSLEQAEADIDHDLEAQVLGLTKWVADWIPDPTDPVIDALAKLEQAASSGD